MTLVELADRLQGDATAVGEIRRGQERAARFTGVAEQIREVTTGLESAAWFLSLMAERGFDHRPDDVRRFAAAGRAKLSTARHAFEADPSWLLEGRNGLDLVDDVKKYRRFLENEVDEVWKEYRAAIPAGERQLVAPLRTHPLADVRANAEAYLANERIVEAAQAGLPPRDQSAWEGLQQALQKRDRLRAALPAETDPEIRAFVAACQGEGAGLGQLTDKVRAWLDETGQAGAFRIVSN